MKNEPTIKYSEFVTENGMDLEVRGEVFDIPIKKTETLEFHTRIEVREVGTENIINRLYFVKENNNDELRILVNGVKSMPKHLREEKL